MIVGKGWKSTTERKYLVKDGVRNKNIGGFGNGFLVHNMTYDSTLGALKTTTQVNSAGGETVKVSSTEMLKYKSLNIRIGTRPAYDQQEKIPTVRIDWGVKTDGTPSRLTVPVSTEPFIASSGIYKRKYLRHFDLSHLDAHNQNTIFVEFTSASDPYVGCIFDIWLE